MLVCGDEITVRASDMHFIKRFGLQEATEMVEAFTLEHSLPFVYDTYQLADLLGLTRTELFRLVRRADRLYTDVAIPKKSGGVRRLRVPQYCLRCVQFHIHHQILSKIPVSRFATAYHKGAALVQNAAPHVGRRYLLKMDLADFFGHIRFDQAYKAAFHTRHFPRQIGALLTTLCCCQERLPQGAPTSPMLSNIVMRHFDDAMGMWCEQRGIAYTRYSDDLTFSGDVPLYAVYIKAKDFLENLGFEINERKTVFVTRASRQSVTGLVVNDKPSVPREYRRRLRQTLYYVAQYGAEDAIIRGKESGFIDENGAPMVYEFYEHLRGQIGYVLSIDPTQTYFREMLKNI